MTGDVPGYVEMQVTTHFSFLRGASGPDELFAEAALLGLPALGVVDGGSLRATRPRSAALGRQGTSSMGETQGTAGGRPVQRAENHSKVSAHLRVIARDVRGRRRLRPPRRGDRSRR